MEGSPVLQPDRGTPLTFTRETTQEASTPALEIRPDHREPVTRPVVPASVEERSPTLEEPQRRSQREKRAPAHLKDYIHWFTNFQK